MSMIRAIRLLVCACAIAGLQGPAAAQDAALPGSSAAPALPQYQVEVVVFAYREFDPTEEVFEHRDVRALAVREEVLQPAPVFDDSNFGPRATAPSPLAQAPPLGGASATGSSPPGAQSGAPPAAETDPAEAAVQAEEFRFRLLRPEELQLTPQYRVLERLQAYHPLVHGGWVQLGLPEQDAVPIDLGVLGVTNPMGSVLLYVSRFLHVTVDVSYQDPLAPEPVTVAGPGGLAEVPLKPRYRLTAERSARSGELHYFDHPAFGVLLKITPVRPDPNAAAAPGTRPAA
jgi:hypothetical protein